MGAIDRTTHSQPSQEDFREVSIAGSTAGRSARGGSGGIYAGITIIVVLVVAVAVGLLTTHRPSPPAIPPVGVPASYPVSVHDGVVIVGKSGAPVTIDAYEDFLCPLCNSFEFQHVDQIQRALNGGRIIIRYHLVDLLAERSNPPGYSLEAANGGLCAAEAGVYPSYHASLYGKQPLEGTAGYTIDQLVALGRALNAQSNFELCVRSGIHETQVKAQLAVAKNNEKLWQQTTSGLRFGTPTVLVNDQLIPVLSPAGSVLFDQLIN